MIIVVSAISLYMNAFAMLYCALVVLVLGEISGEAYKYNLVCSNLANDKYTFRQIRSGSPKSSDGHPTRRFPLTDVNIVRVLGIQDHPYFLN